MLIRARVHPFPFRTRKLSSFLPKILVWRRTGKIGSAYTNRTVNNCPVFVWGDFVAWKLYNISSGHYTIDNFELEAEDISVVLQQLQDYFQDRLVLGNQAGIGLSLVGVDILIDGNLLTVGWDTWSGIFIMASDAAGDAILRQLESYLNHK